MLHSILSCLCVQGFPQLLPSRHGASLEPRMTFRNDRYRDTPTSDEKAILSTEEIEHKADEFLRILLHTDEIESIAQHVDGYQHQYMQVQYPDKITAQSWKEYFTSLILCGLETTIRNGMVIGNAMHDAVEHATVAAAVDFVKEHPVYFTLIAIGALVVLAPWILELLGFAELGPVEGKFPRFIYRLGQTKLTGHRSGEMLMLDKATGSFAASWQAIYAGYVPKGSLFSYLQRLGMVWHH